MKILHIAPNTNGYEEVILVANRCSTKIHLAVILRENKKCLTGGYLLNNTPEIRVILDKISLDKQYDFVKSFKSTPFVKLYASTN
jgi:hypothetical protein